MPTNRAGYFKEYKKKHLIKMREYNKQWMRRWRANGKRPDSVPVPKLADLPETFGIPTWQELNERERLWRLEHPNE